MNRESLLPLSISALLAVSLHASIVIWYGLSLAQEAKAATSQPAPKPILPDPSPKPPEPPQPPELEKPKPPEPKPEPEPEAAKAPTPKPLEIGRDGEPMRSTVAWIPYDDFKKLMAPESLTIQPALQTQADPTAGAPVELNPSTANPTPATILTHTRSQQDEQVEQAAQTPANPTAPADPTDIATAATPPAQVPAQTPADTSKTPELAEVSQPTQTPVTSTAATATTADSPSAAAPVLPQANAEQAPIADASAKDERLALAPLQRVNPNTPPADAPSATQPAKKTPGTPDASSTPNTSTKQAQPAKAASSASESNEDRPTSVPRSDRESIATQNTPMPDQIVLGRVLVSDGIEIKTVRPRFNISTLFTATPRNPIATIVFDKTGQVVRAELVLSSGFADIDSPILNSLYRWRASGKKLENHKSATFTIRHMKLLLVDDRKEKADDDESKKTPSPDASPDATPNE